MLTTSSADVMHADANGLLMGILNASQDAIFVLKAIRGKAGQIRDFSYSHANRKVTELFGHSAETLRQSTFLTLYPNAEAVGLFTRFGDVINTGTPYHDELYYGTEGLNAWYEISASRLDGFDAVAVTAKDISERKRQEQYIEQENDLVQSMLNGALNGILLLEPVRNDAGDVIDFMIRGGNPAVRVHTGVDADAAIGHTMQQMYPGYKEAGFFDLYCRVLATGRPERKENYYEDNDLQGWFEVSAVRQTSPGTGYGIVLTFANTTEARRTQQALERSAADLQAVIDNSQTGIFVFSPIYDEAGELTDFRFKTINRMVAALVGQTPDVVTGTPASAWFISYRDTEIFGHYKHTFETGEERRFDINYNVDGFDVWFDVKSIKFGPDVLVTFTDYTALKKAQQDDEQRLAEMTRQADLLNSVLNSSISGIMSFESIRDENGQIADFRFVTINDACERILSMPVSAIRGETLLTIYPGNVETGLFDMYVRTVETGEPTRTETYYNLDGLDFWLDISARKLGDGFVVTFNDTSIMKRAAKALEQSAEEMQTVIDTSQTGIFLFSPIHNDRGEVVDFRFRVANRMLAAYVGQEPDAIVGEPGSRWFPGYKVNGLFDYYLKTYHTGEMQRFDFHYDTDGIDVWLDIMSTKMGNEVLVTFADYTPLKQLQQQLENTVVDLQRSNRNLEQFAYVASHDLQEPLRKIQAFGDIIETQYAPQLGQEGGDLIRRMTSSAQRMQILIKDVLAYSRIATRREANQPVDLNQVFNDVLGNLETAISEKRAYVHIDKLPIILGDAAQLRQVFQNLISNALKFMKPGQVPNLRVNCDAVMGREAKLHVLPADLDRLFYQIDVTDNGIGFEPHHAERIFQVFQRLHSRSEYAGTGIGLAIVQRVIENHQGYITAEGRPGEGATFRLLLPA